MKSITQLLLLFVLLAGGAHALATPQRLARGPNPNLLRSFRDRCVDASLGGGGPSGWVLSATCYPRGEERGYLKTLELDKCIENRRGGMRFSPNGNFSGTCKGCELRTEPGPDGAVNLACLCLKPDKSALMLGKEGYLDLAGSVTYIGGELRCNV